MKPLIYNVNKLAVYVQIDAYSDEIVWYSNYVGKIFYVVQNIKWGNSWQLYDGINNLYDLYISKNDCHIIELNDENKGEFVWSAMIKI